MSELNTALNTLAGTTGLDAQGAANAWAGVSGWSLLGALNLKAGNHPSNGRGLVAVLNQLAGTTSLGVLAAVSSISVGGGGGGSFAAGFEETF